MSLWGDREELDRVEYDERLDETQLLDEHSFDVVAETLAPEVEPVDPWSLMDVGERAAYRRAS